MFISNNFFKKISHLFFLFLFIGPFLIVAISSNSLAREHFTGLLSDEKNTIEVFKKFSPLAVNVHSLRTVVDPYFDIFQIKKGSGSGFLWNRDGYVVTNYHVIRHSKNIAVTLNHGKTVLAKIVGVAPKKDIAVLKLNSTKSLSQIMHYNQIPMADSSGLQVGQKTIAIGNPFGLSRTLTTGVVSALDREVPGVGGVSLRGMIQTDASVNPGNSGGPLLNSQGELIGMNTMIYTRSGTASGIGFAIPSNDIKRFVNQIIRNGKITQPGLGIHILSKSVAAQLNIKGVIVERVILGSPAEKAGLKGSIIHRDGTITLGDVIISIDSKPINNYNDLYGVLSNKRIGQEVTVEVLRNNKVKRLKLKTISVTP